MIYPLVQNEADPILTTPAKKVKEITPEICQLLQDMVETMYQNKGIGLAAPQVGVGLRVIVVHLWSEDTGRDPERAIRLINPHLAEAEGEEIDSEGCLSLPGLLASVPRFTWIKVTGLNEKGKRVTIEAEGLLARALQHEIDHINGKLIIHRAVPGSVRQIIPAEEAKAEENEEK